MNRAYLRSPYWDRYYRIVSTYDFKPNLCIIFYRRTINISAGDFRFGYYPFLQGNKVSFYRKSLYTETRFKRFLKVK